MSVRPQSRLPEFYFPVAERLMPSNVEAEQALLGSVLLDSSVLSVVSALVRAEDFYIEKHRWIFQAMLQVTALDVVTLKSELERTQRLDAVGGASYLTQLLNCVPTAAHAREYASLVERAATERRILHASTEIAELAYASDLDISSKLARVRLMTDALEAHARADAFEVLRVSDMGEFETPPEIVGGLVQTPSLNFWYGESGGGKTWLLLDLLFRVSRGEQWAGIETRTSPVLIVDTESGKLRIKNRLRSLEVGYRATFGAASFVITDRAVNLNLGALGAQRDEAIRHRDLLKECIRETGAKLIVVDAFADIAQGADENAAQGVMPVLNALREISNETDCAIVCIHHTNRNGTSRGGNYRGSSAIKGAVDSMVEIQTVPSGSGFVAKIETVKQRDGKAVQAFVRSVFREVVRDPNNFNSLMTAFSLEAADETDFDVDLRAILDALGNEEMSFSEIFSATKEEIGSVERTVQRKLKKLVELGAVIRTGDAQRNMRYHRAAER